LHLQVNVAAVEEGEPAGPGVVVEDQPPSTAGGVLCS